MGGLEGMVQHSGYPALQTLFHLTFFLWGCIKGRVCATPVAVCYELKTRMQEHVDTVIENMLQNNWREV